MYGIFTLVLLTCLFLFFVIWSWHCIADGGPGAPLPFTPSSELGSLSRRFERNKNVSSPSTCESQYCGGPPWPRSSVLGLRPPGSNFESCVWRTVSSQSSPHPQEVLLAQFSLYVHKGGQKPDSFHLFADAISSFKWRKKVYLFYEKILLKNWMISLTEQVLKTIPPISVIFYSVSIFLETIHKQQHRG